uniref:Uncharacterized protein n=1 Tax=Dendroctonus ponderosae TaxID=77166 RepID=J3JVT1_DENPD|nr:unknown [Dendroctonus ponderosae]
MKLLVLSTLFLVSESVKLPSNFKTCNRKQADFDTCLLEAANYDVKLFKKPIKEFKTPSLDPLVIPKIIATVGSPLATVTATLKNCIFSGLIDTQIENFVFDFEKKIVELKANFPELKSHCAYEIDGKIFFVDVKGKGDNSSAIFKNFKWTFKMTYAEIPRRGKTYVKPILTYFDGKPESLTINIDGLFDGDKELGERANKVINDNWSAIYDSVKYRYLENAKEVWLELFNEWFKKLSLEEAFDNN